MTAPLPDARMAAGAPSAESALARRPKGVAAVKQGERTVLVDLNRGRFYGLDGVAAQIWEMLEHGAETAEIEAQIEREYDVSREQIAGDLRALIQQLRSRRLVS
jgi:hypothetical protein